VQQKGGPLQRREPIDRQQQRDGEILGELALGVRRERARVEDRFWQPRADICLPAGARRLERIQAILVVVVVRNARTSDTVSRSMACQRRYASWTASSASEMEPSMRYASPSSRRRCGSKVTAGSVMPIDSRAIA
jgi:hypothetical protein